MPVCVYMYVSVHVCVHVCMYVRACACLLFVLCVHVVMLCGFAHIGACERSGAVQQ